MGEAGKALLKPRGRNHKQTTRELQRGKIAVKKTLLKRNFVRQAATDKKLSHFTYT